MNYYKVSYSLELKNLSYIHRSTLLFQDSKSDWKEFYSWKPDRAPHATKLDGIKVDVSLELIYQMS